MTDFKLILTVKRGPVRGMTQAEWLEAQCFAILSKDEMAHCGSRWRWRISHEPDKLERVLAEVRFQQREGLKIRNAGAYAEDLWKRFA